MHKKICPYCCKPSYSSIAETQRWECPYCGKPFLAIEGEERGRPVNHGFDPISRAPGDSEGGLRVPTAKHGEAVNVEVTVRTFAAVAEALGFRTMALELPEGATVADAWQEMVRRFPQLEVFRNRVLPALNQEYAAWQARLQSGDEVAFLPPVSGGNGAPVGCMWEITEEPLSADRLIDRVRHPEAGAVTLFAGIVREFTGGRRTVHLEYEAYRDMALKEMARIGNEVAERWPGVRLAISHRIGRLATGEASVMVAAAAPHRSEAFAAGRYAIDRLKEIVPIWKKERWEDGEEWVGPQTGP
ncbi:MAG: molybdenum cofactor biosynthesis protein MoaE [Firmicutes bacterium]|nr:molybdenum cofactor biosynthesis protein MoaE [Bacillota bacterium]